MSRSFVKTSGVVNHFYFYFYFVDDDFGPFFLKFCSYFPYNAKLCINGHEWAKRQAAKAGIGFTALDNGFAAADDVVALQAICNRLGPEQIDALLRKWLARLPHPFGPADRSAGYRYELSILQAEFSLTQMLDQPVSGRVVFEQVIRDNLDIGRPGQVSLVFDRRLRRRGLRATPGPFRTRVITDEVTPSLHINYKHTRIKQYHKEGRALRTETTINDTTDFSIGKRLHNLPSLWEIGFTASRRLLRVHTISHDPITGADALHSVTATSAPHPGPASPAYASVNSAAIPCSPRCQCSDCNRAGSPTRTCARWSPACAASPRQRSPPDRSPTICAGSACAASSPASPAPIATSSPSTAYTPPCFSPPSTTDSCPPASRSSPTTPAHPRCARPPARTTQRSKTSAVQQVSPHDTYYQITDPT